ncbi:MAG: hypothetical protein HY553_07120, partial [Elusimicrobia bacterium]|nr:hypothetical protein [Elusimicrobiota bacterium]
MLAEPLLVALAALAGAAPGSALCVAVEGVGCLYAPATLSQEAPAPLLVYLRGHLPPHGGSVPGPERVASARQAAAKFELYRLADR